MATRKDYEDEMGEGYSKPEKMIAGVRKVGKQAFGEDEASYEEDFDTLVTKDEIKAKIEECQAQYKKARSDDEKMSLLRKKTKLQAKLAELKE